MNHIVLLDGGMGQELIARSSQPASPMWSAKVMMDEPEIVEAVHLDYIKTGARVITLNAYSATPERLQRDGGSGLFEKLQEQACLIAKKARYKSGESEVLIAGCLPPLVASYKPELAPDFEGCLEIYRQIVAKQIEHVDLFLCETLASEREVRAATQAASETGKSVWTGMSVKDGEGSLLRSGESLELAVAGAKQSGASAVLINCSWPESVTQGLPFLKASGLPFGAYANGFTSIDALDAGGTVDALKARTDLGPDAYADHVMSWIDQGATIVGGCCEVGPAHIKRLAERLQKNNYNISGELNV